MKRLIFALAMMPAAQATADPAECAKMTNDTARLVCYDMTFRGNAPAFTAQKPSPQSPPSPKKSKWEINVKKSDFEDTQDVYMSVKSTKPVQCRKYGTAGYVNLHIRCLENTTSIYFAGDCHLTSGHGGYGRVDVRVDERKPTTVSMDESTDNQALGLWRGGSAIPFIKRIISAEKLLLRFTPFGMSPVTAEFNIHGLEAEIGQLRKQCSW